MGQRIYNREQRIYIIEQKYRIETIEQRESNGKYKSDIRYRAWRVENKEQRTYNWGQRIENGEQRIENRAQSIEHIK